MARVKRGTTSHARHKKLLKQTKGYRGRANSCISVALMRLEKGLQYAYRDRRTRKRDFRRLWIQRINAGARQHDLTYGQFMHGLKLAGVDLDRKILADLAAREPASFSKLCDEARSAVSSAA